MSIYHYPVITDLIPDLPKMSYRNGSYEGVVIHSTDEDGDNAQLEHQYEKRSWQKAFVHEFIDANTCLVQADENYHCWGCGPNGNQRYYQIEMCMAKTQAEFNAIFDRTAFRAAYKLFQKGLQVTDNVTVRSHRQIAVEFPNDTDHQDPISYLEKWGSSWQKLIEQIQVYYKALQQEQLEQNDWKVKAIADAKAYGFFKSDHTPGEPVTIEMLAGTLNSLYRKLGGK